MKDIFYQIAHLFTQKQSDVTAAWQLLEKSYTQSGRHYHNLQHIGHLLDGVGEWRSVTEHPALLMAIFYHDAVYNALASDNEEKSARLAQKELRVLQFPDDVIEHCAQLILATKRHVPVNYPDADLLLDLDLAILGSSWEHYLEYTRQIRREYGVFPNILYKPGRKKVLEKFLERPFIYQTDAFRRDFEEKARANIQTEIGLL
jgi:predicted metal-dependent HD superfamily phosphohydrolase